MKERWEVEQTEGLAPNNTELIPESGLSKVNTLRDGE